MIAMAVLAIASGCVPAHSRAGDVRQPTNVVGATSEEVYYVEGGWGHLKFGAVNDGGRRPFNIETVSDGNECAIKGEVSKDLQSLTVFPISATSKCDIAMSQTSAGVEVVAGSDGCSDYCGYNASFEGVYLAVDPICTSESIESITQQLPLDVVGGDNALVTAERALQVCKKTMTYYTSSKLRVEAAKAFERAGDRKECALMLSPYAEDVSKTEDELAEGKTPNALGDILEVMDLVRPVLMRCQTVG